MVNSLSMYIFTMIETYSMDNPHKHIYIIFNNWKWKSWVPCLDQLTDN